MRIPFSKRYRAFPELDRFSDAECERFEKLASKQYPGSLMILGFTNVVLWVGLMILGVWLADEIVWAVRGMGMGDAFEFADWIALTGVGLTVLASSLAVMLRYDRWLRRAMVVRLREAACVGCSYSLLGLEVVDGGVLCPECGQRFDLAERGLTAADVLSQGPGKAGT